MTNGRTTRALRRRLAGELRAMRPAGVRPARRRDAIRVAVVFTRSMERPRRHPPQLRKLVPLRPLRLAVYWLTGLIIVLVAELTLLAGSPSAVLAVDQQDPTAQARKLARALGVFAASGVVVLTVGGLLALIVPDVVFRVLQWAAAVVLGGCGVRVAVANRQLRGLRAAGRTAAARLPGPAWWLTGFASTDSQAAITLGRAVCELADQVQAALLAVAEGSARIHAYQRAGFTVHGEVGVDGQPCALLIRWPQSHGKPSAPTPSGNLTPADSEGPAAARKNAVRDAVFRPSRRRPTV